jgi:hypothetical protein
MNVLTAARAHLVDIYQLAGIDAYLYTPPTVVPPIVTVLPASAWVEPNRVGKYHAKVELTVTAYVSLIDPSTSLEQLEQLLDELILATPTGVLITSIDAPRVDSTSSQGDLLASDINIHAQVRRD